MNRLQSELQRLCPASAGAAGGLRALVMELSGPADWGDLAKVWRGVQADLQLPAPAIAVSGHDALQLWFSLQAPVSRGRAADFLERLRARYLPDIALKRTRLTPPATDVAVEWPVVPAQSASTGNWSAYVAPDLAPVFADAPWLDIEPNAEGQADLLAGLESITPAAWDAALRLLAPAASRPAAATELQSPGAPGDVDPRRFLQQVLNDDTVELALRIEAAKALLNG